MSLILSPDEVLRFPAGDGVSSDIVFDLRPVFTAKARLVELQAITRLKAGELVHAFIRAWSDTAKLAKQAERQLTRAKRKLKEVRAVVILDRVPAELVKRGWATSRSPVGSEDIRESIVDNDAEYQKASDRLEQIQAAVAILTIDAETFKMAYFSVNKLVDPYDRTQNDTSGGIGEGEVGAMTDSERVEEFVSQHGTVKQQNYRGAFGAPKL
jgi:hypothetical protein